MSVATQKSAMIFILFITPFQFLWAQHEELSSGSKTHPEITGQEASVSRVFESKCLTCHEGDGKFNEAGVPLSEFKQSALNSIRKKPGFKPMPPSSSEQLTREELKQVDQWANDGEKTEDPSDFCSHEQKRKNTTLVKEIFSDRCVTCHGKLSFNPTSILRTAHTSFLNNDGSLDTSNLGDISEIPAYSIPTGRTSLGRVLSDLTGYTMPPRGNLPVFNKPSESLLPEMGTPHMTDMERQYLIRALNQKVQQDLCPIEEQEWVKDSKTGKASLQSYRDAAKSCDEKNMRIPTRLQLINILESKLKNESVGDCVWSSTFGESLTKDKNKIWRKALLFSLEGKSDVILKPEKDQCRTVCVR